MDWGIFWTIVGIAVTVIVAIIFLPRRYFFFSLRGNAVIVDYKTKLKGLSVAYDTKEVENLSVTRLAFWNQGLVGHIDHNDIAKLDPILIRPKKEGVEILAAIPVFCSSEANGIVVIPKGDGTYLVDFDYLNPREGAVLQVIHTGADPIDIIFDGKIKGISKLTRKKVSTTRQPMFSFVTSFVAVTALAFDLIIVNPFLGTSANAAQAGTKLENTPFSTGIYALFVGLIFIMLIIIVVDEFVVPRKIKSQLYDLPLEKKG